MFKTFKMFNNCYGPGTDGSEQTLAVAQETPWTTGLSNNSVVSRSSGGMEHPIRGQGWSWRWGGAALGNFPRRSGVLEQTLRCVFMWK